MSCESSAPLKENPDRKKKKQKTKNMCFIQRWLIGWFLKVIFKGGQFDWSAWILICLNLILLTDCADQLIYNLSLIKLRLACAKQNAAVNASDAC